MENNYVNETYVKQHITDKSIKRKNIVDAIAISIFKTASFISASFIIVIVVIICIKGIRPFFAYGVENVNIIDFITGFEWHAPVYGVLYIVIDTLYITFLSILVAAPVGVLTALFIAKIAPEKLAKIMRVIIESLASIPSVIFGVFGAGVVTIFVRDTGELFGIITAGGLSIFATVVVLSIMILPTITTVSEVSIRSVDKNLVNGSLALGATPTQTNFKVVIKAAVPGIFSGIILAVGRALGEATVVSMVCGNKMFGPSFSLFDTSRTLTSTILLGLKETTGVDYDVRFSVGLVLIGIVLLTNFILNKVKNKVINNGS